MGRTCTETAVKKIDADACTACTGSFEKGLGDCQESFRQTADSAIDMAKSTCSAVIGDIPNIIPDQSHGDTGTANGASAVGTTTKIVIAVIGGAVAVAVICVLV